MTKTKKRKKAEAKEEAQRAKDAKKLAMTCGVKGCNKITRVEGGAKGWSQCGVCMKLYCKLHKDNYNVCVTTCLQDGETKINSVSI